MESMFQRIRRMTADELRTLIYAVYLCGNKDGRAGYEDSPSCSYFGDGFLHVEARALLPSGDVQDLFASWGLE